MNSFIEFVNTAGNEALKQSLEKKAVVRAPRAASDLGLVSRAMPASARAAAFELFAVLQKQFADHGDRAEILDPRQLRALEPGLGAVKRRGRGAGCLAHAPFLVHQRDDAHRPPP